MQGDTKTETRLSRALIWIGVAIVTLFSLPYAAVFIERSKRGGGTFKYLGVERWQDAPLYSIWAFSFLVALTLITVGASLGNAAIPKKLAVSIPLTICSAGCLFVYFTTIPHIIPAFFGIGGTINAIGSVITCSLAAKLTKIDPERPLPGLLRCVGYMCFGFTTWASCATFSTPSETLFPDLKPNPAVAIDFATKVQILWIIAWSTTAASFLLERRTAPQRSAAPQRSEGALSSPAVVPALAREELVVPLPHG